MGAGFSQTMDDASQTLVQRAARRTAASSADAQRAFVALYEEHGRMLRAWLATRVARSDLEDIHQEIWSRAWEKLPTQFTGGSFRGWLFTIARNHIVDASRRRRVRRTTDFGGTDDGPEMLPPDPDADEPVQIVIDRERGIRLHGCLEKLDVGRRRVIVGRLRNEEYTAIAGELGISTAQAQSWLFVAKKLLRECLGEDA